MGAKSYIGSFLGETKLYKLLYRIPIATLSNHFRSVEWTV
jgi:hypothetical protein